MNEVDAFRKTVVGRFLMTVEETTKKEEDKVVAAFRTWKQWLSIAESGILLYADSEDKFRSFSENFGEVTRDFSTSIFSALAGSYKGATQILRSCLDLTLEMVLKLRGVQFAEDEGFSDRVYHARTILGRWEYRDSLKKWHHRLSGAAHSKEGERDFPNLLTLTATSDHEKGPKSADKGANQVSGGNPTPIQIADEPTVLGPLDIFLSIFHPERLHDWLTIYWGTYKTCFALASKLFTPLWLRNPALIPNKPIQHLLNRELQKGRASDVSFNFITIPKSKIKHTDSYHTPKPPDGLLYSSADLEFNVEDVGHDSELRSKPDRYAIADYRSIITHLIGILEVSIDGRKWYLV